MRLKIRYENEFQTIELDAAATEQLWVGLSLEGEGLSQKDREQRIQDAFNEAYNKPEYNIWHRETRHIDPTPKRKRMDGRSGYIQADADDAAFNIMDYLLTTSDTETHDLNVEHEEVCTWIRKVLEKKPEWADAFIAVYIDGELVRDYADRTGNNENNISQKLKRAKKKLKEACRNRQI